MKQAISMYPVLARKLNSLCFFLSFPGVVVSAEYISTNQNNIHIYIYIYCLAELFEKAMEREREREIYIY